MACQTSWTLEEAKENLRLWLEAAKTVATGQSYRIGTRWLTRASLREINEQIRFWRGEVAKLEYGYGNGVRVLRIVPRDL